VNLITKTLASVILFLSISGLQGQIISSTILSESDSLPIQGVHIINITSQYGVVSDENGLFSISAKPKDSILISTINFEIKKIVASGLLSTFYLKKRDYELEAYTVLPYKNFKEFKKAFIEFDLPDTTKNVNQSIFLSKYELRMSSAPSGIVFVGGISAILGHFNKYVQDKKKYESVMHNYDKKRAILTKKFNPVLVKRITNEKDDDTVASFMLYCDFSEYFIQYSSEYEMAKQVITCYEEYNSVTASGK
jgi:hypothetical protein